MAAELLQTLLRLTLASSIAVIAALALRHPLRARFGAHVAYLIWMLVPVAIAAALLPAPTVVAPMDFPLPPHSPVSTTLVPTQAVAHAPIDFSAPAFFAWLAGAWMCAVALSMQQRRFIRRLGSLVSAGERVWVARTAEGCPALVGAWQPRIVIPADFEARYSETERTLILAHERMHVARGDAQANMVVAVLRCLFWFNPLLHFAASRFRFDQELACDAAVITRFPEARRSYADAMLKTQLADLGLPVGCHWQSSHPLKERISMLKKTLPSRTRRSVGVALAIVLVAAGAAAGWAAQPKNAVPGAQADIDANAIRSSLVIRIDDKTLGSGWTFHSSMHSPNGHYMHSAETPSLFSFTGPAGNPFTFSMDNGSESWQIDGAANRLADGTMKFSGTVLHNGSVVSEPALISRDNEASAVKIGENQADGSFKGFEAQITLASPDMPQTIAPFDPAADHGPTYRAISRIEYPAAQATSGADATVLVTAHVGIDGKVVSTGIRTVNGNTKDTDAFRRAALDGVQNWTFNPAQKNGKPAAGDALVPVIFEHDNALSDELPRDALDAIHIMPAREADAQSNDKPPTEIVESRKMNPPHYPQGAIAARKSGKIVLKVLVDARGVPQAAEVFKSTPPEAERIFADASIAAAMRWMFTPGTHEGKPQSGYVLVPITYSLKEDKG